MKKIFLWGLAGLSAVFFALVLIVPAKIGSVVYESVTGLEAQVYGLEQMQIDIGEMKISLYQNTLSNRPTIVMLHGFSADKDNWLRFAKYFTDDFNVVIPDMAGHGDTGFDKSWDYSTPVQATRLVQIIENLDINRVHVIGNSMGGSIAAQFVKIYPRHTLSVALVDPGGVRSPLPSAMDKMLVQGNNPFLIDSREEFDSFYAMTMQRPPYIPDFILEAVSEKYQQRREQLIQIHADFHGNDLLDSSLGEVTVPVLLLWGEEDQLIDVSSVDVWKKEIKQLQVKVWQDIGHMPMLEIPQQSAEVYREFLGQIK